jgi:hypothetical protein
MTLYLFLFLLLLFLILYLVQLWHFYWLHHNPPRSRGGAVHTIVQASARQRNVNVFSEKRVGINSKVELR